MNSVSRLAPILALFTIFVHPATAANLGDPAAPLKIAEWVKGSPVTLEKGEKVYVVEFWATWCGPCRDSIPHLTELQKKYKDKNVVFIGVSQEESTAVKPFVTDMGDKMDYVVAVDDAGQTNDGYMGAFEQGGIPTAFIVDKQGRVAWFGHPMDDMESVLDEIIAGTFDPVAAQKEREMEDVRQQIFEEFTGHMESGDVAKATELAEKVLVEHSTSGSLLNAFAATLLMGEGKDEKTSQLALRLAKAAMAATKKEEPRILYTYAMALQSNGDLDGAIENMKKVVDLVPEEYRQELQTKVDELVAQKNGAKPDA